MRSLHSGRERPGPRIAKGVISQIDFRPRSQEFAFSWGGARSLRGLYSYDIESTKTTAWATPRPALIRKPLLVIHGANDSRVPVLQSDQLVSSVRRNGNPVWYVRFDGEGHGLTVTDDHNYKIEVVSLFLRRYLLMSSSIRADFFVGQASA
jgi:pimeloyl-ACP methyl ester carboxylesterase